MATGATLFSEALEHVESASIREWATSDRNRPLWLQIADHAIANGKNDPVRFATYMLVKGMGF